MANYYDKKKLLDENQDLYLSEYDKNLDPSALNGIIESKRSYQNAQQSGDAAGMKRANDKANEIRKQFGGYTGGDDGSEYNRAAKSYEIRNTNGYKSEYETEKKNIMNRISDMADFSYDPEADPLFRTYKELYTKLGEDAFDRALSQNALRSGGVNSTSAMSAAALAQNRYNTMLSVKIPELYEASYKKYADEYERLYKQLDAISKLDEAQYSRYRDSLADFEADREYFGKKDSEYMNYLSSIYDVDSDIVYNTIKNENDLAYKTQKDKEDMEYKINRDNREYEYKTNKDNRDYEYKKYRDEIEDNHWQAEFNQNASSDKYNIAIALAKALYGRVPVSSSAINTLLSYIK